jgi:pyruvate formate lyase activating enzyme
MNGNMIDIKKFTVHDGPGIRSTVFLKGCPLRCVWCHNPEGIDSKINLWYFEKKCIGCHRCVAACKNHALAVGSGNPHIIIDREECTNAGFCVEACPTTALCFDGKTVSHQEVVEALIEDKPFYDKSGGGITLSGGDPLLQYEFSLEILKDCKKHKIHTAIETCMYAKEEIFEKFLDYVDLFIVDLKIFNSILHKEYTGVENELIKSNFEFLASKREHILVRIPLIPGITATKENIGGIAAFVHGVNSRIPIELMNFNPLGENKYRLMGKTHGLLHGMKPLPEAELDELYQTIIDKGVEIIREKKVQY